MIVHGMSHWLLATLHFCILVSGCNMQQAYTGLQVTRQYLMQLQRQVTMLLMTSVLLHLQQHKQAKMRRVMMKVIVR